MVLGSKRKRRCLCNAFAILTIISDMVRLGIFSDLYRGKRRKKKKCTTDSFLYAFAKFNCAVAVVPPDEDGMQQLRILATSGYKERVLRALLGKQYLPPVLSLLDGRNKENNTTYRSASVLTGHIVGMDTTVLTPPNQETGEPGRRKINCLVMIGYRVKVLIPEQKIWYSKDTRRPSHMLRSMTGSVIDYAITGIDCEGECCTASRRMVLAIHRPFM